MRVLVTGSRDWPKPNKVWSELESLYHSSFGPEKFTVVHGDCPTGADKEAASWVRWAVEDEGYYVEAETYPADWNGPLKKGAGPARNAEMVNLGADICLAFIHNESPGATHCAKLAEKAGIKTRIFRSETPMAKRVREELKLENIRMIFRNFAGEEKMYNDKGKRNFAIPLEEDIAKELAEIGWNVRGKDRVNDDGQTETLYHLPVTVKMDGKVPPRIFMITKSKNSRNQLDEDTVGLLDYAEFDMIDVILRPFNWDVNGKQGVTAYLKTLFATIREDDLEKKYAHIPEEGAPLALEAGDDIIDVEGEWVDDDQLALES